MICLKIDEVKFGMILAESVYNQQDLLLLEQGVSLTKKRIWMLKTWGVDEVCVKGKPRGDAKNAETAEMAAKEAIENELKDKFADVADDPVMLEIMKVANRQLQKSLNNQSEGNESN